MRGLLSHQPTFSEELESTDSVITPKLQSKLSIEDMLYSGNLAIAVAGTLSWNWQNHGQNLIEKALDSGHF